MKARRIFRSATTFVAMTMVQGCGTDSSSRLSGKARVDEPPVFFLLGGRASCSDRRGTPDEGPRGSGLFESFLEIRKRIFDESGVEAEYFSACHMGGTNLQAYASSWEPEVRYWQSEKQLREQVRQKQMAMVSGRAVVVGHSYGGWITMSLLSREMQDQTVDHVYTIDAISKVTCSFGSPSGCQSAPEDIRADERQRIADNSERWSNYYQTNTFYLHSGPINEADENVHLAKRSHTDIDKAVEAWADIYRTGLELAGRTRDSRF